ncbi:MAG: methylenetetrahydrofolate reductase [Bacteroidaceae bacterium]|nr:methylenetetrahydrofolate reductase [NAD(P)H] [Bacteroidales bacterium]MBQ3189012.1 methylenetetrahydrofolate reductase [NAD(P)H] [Bacteroidaceae bacterium]
MRVIDYINSSDKTAFSFEVLPPVKGTGVSRLFGSIDKLMEFDPKYINITTHHSENIYVDLGNGMFRRSRIRRRPGTVAVATAINHRYGVPVVPHILCCGFTTEETEYVLIDLQLSGITDVLVLRGDKAKEDKNYIPTEGGHTHAIELQRQINRFNEGFFIDGTPMKERGLPFSYGVACYPEKHEEAPNIESDIAWLKQKVDEGAEYAVTQMFFDNAKYFEFVKRAREAGITVPIIPGIKPLYKKSQLSVLPKTFRVDMPPALVAEVEKCKNEADVALVGQEWCTAQCKELIANGVPSIHFYTVNAVEQVYEVAKSIY